MESRTKRITLITLAAGAVLVFAVTKGQAGATFHPGATIRASVAITPWISLPASMPFRQPPRSGAPLMPSD
jgi:hypothetical protein